MRCSSFHPSIELELSWIGERTVDIVNVVLAYFGLILKARPNHLVLRPGHHDSERLSHEI